MMIAPGSINGLTNIIPNSNIISIVVFRGLVTKKNSLLKYYRLKVKETS